MLIQRSHVAVAAVLAAPVLGACGGGGSDTTSTTTTASARPAHAPQRPAVAAHALTIHMTEFAFRPKDTVVKKGKVTITAPNDGKTVHELVLLRTDANPARLPKKGGKVDESTSVGEIADVEPGATKKATFRLKPGRYALVCALPGHYEGGMYGSLIVRKA